MEYGRGHDFPGPGGSVLQIHPANLGQRDSGRTGCRHEFDGRFRCWGDSVRLCWSFYYLAGLHRRNAGRQEEPHCALHGSIGHLFFSLYCRALHFIAHRHPGGRRGRGQPGRRNKGKTLESRHAVEPAQARNIERGCSRPLRLSHERADHWAGQIQCLLGNRGPGPEIFSHQERQSRGTRQSGRVPQSPCAAARSPRKQRSPNPSPVPPSHGES